MEMHRSHPAVKYSKLELTFTFPLSLFAKFIAVNDGFGSGSGEKNGEDFERLDFICENCAFKPTCNSIFFKEI